LLSFDLKGLQIILNESMTHHVLVEIKILKYMDLNIGPEIACCDRFAKS